MLPPHGPSAPRTLAGNRATTTLRIGKRPPAGCYGQQPSGSRTPSSTIAGEQSVSNPDGYQQQSGFGGTPGGYQQQSGFGEASGAGDAGQGSPYGPPGQQGYGQQGT